MKHQWAAWLAVVMLATGACCCRGEVAATVAKADHGCCAEGKLPAKKASDDCGCAGKVLFEAKAVQGNAVVVVGSSDLQVFEPLLAVCRGNDGHVLSGQRATAHAPPPVHRQRLLQVWLI